MIDSSARNSAISKPQMSAIREVSSVSNHEATSSYPNSNDTKLSGKANEKLVSKNGYKGAKYLELDDEVKEIMQDMVKAKT